MKVHDNMTSTVHAVPSPLYARRTLMTDEADLSRTAMIQYQTLKIEYYCVL